MIPPWRQAPPLAPSPPPPRARHADSTGPIDLAEYHDADDDDLVIRPFLLTGGRTRPTQEGLRVEALIQASSTALRSNLRFEARQIAELCQKPISVAELAAALHTPLGVARVLVSDLMADGLVTLVQREDLSVQLIERIRDRVRAL
jgi:hypothetical protein